MRIVNIPALDFSQTGNKFIKIKASQYGDLAEVCFFKGILARAVAGNNSVSLPLPAKTYTGIVAHNVLEMALKRKFSPSLTFDEAWNQQIVKMEIIIRSNFPDAPWLLPLRDYEKQFRTKLIVQQIQNRLGQRSAAPGIRPDAEEKFDQVDYLQGRIDLITYGADYVEISDFKTGLILNKEAEIKPVYQLQMKLYAILFQKTKKKRVNKLSLINLAGDKFNVPFDQNELEELYQQVTDTVHRINGIMNAGDYQILANTSIDNCRFCNYRPACSYYWQSGIISNSDIQGKFLDVKVVQGGVLFIDLEVNNEKKFIKGLPADYLEQLQGQQGRVLRIVNISPFKQSHLSNYYQATTQTALFWPN